MLMSEYVPGKRFMGLFVGKPKTSKTVQAAGWVYDPTVDPDHRILHLDLDGRCAPIAQFYPSKLDLIERRYYSPKPQDFEKLLRDFEELQDKCPYRTTIFDGLTMLGDDLISYMLSLRGSVQGEGEKALKGKRRGVLELAGVEDFGGEARGMSQILNIAAVIPCNFIMTAHFIVSESTNILTGKTTVTKQLVTAGKKVAARVPINFDEIYFFEKQTSMTPGEAPDFIVHTQGDEESFAGTCLPLDHTLNVTMKPNDPGDRCLYKQIQKALAGEKAVSL
jgi:hypothetical protein